MYDYAGGSLVAGTMLERTNIWNRYLQRYDENGRVIPLDENTIIVSLARLSLILRRKYNKDVIIILDKYDTLLQSAYLSGYWNKAAEFFGLLFKKTFKENEFLDKALITGISRVSKESLFSPFNNPLMCLVTTPYYEGAFGFTQEEVDIALSEYNMEDRRDDVKRWYDGYRFGRKDGMYNPWSIVNFLSSGETESYWANTASNEIVSHLVRNGSVDLKDRFVVLMQGGAITAKVNEDTSYKTLLASNETVWGLLLACGYLKAIGKEGKEYSLALVNHEVREMMDSLVLACLSMEMFGSHDVSGHEGDHELEKFYHGFVLGIVAAMRDRFVVSSNPESGKGRCGILMEPRDKRKDHGIIIEFKVFNPRKKRTSREHAKGRWTKSRQRNTPLSWQEEACLRKGSSSSASATRARMSW